MTAVGNVVVVGSKSLNSPITVSDNMQLNPPPGYSWLLLATLTLLLSCIRLVTCTHQSDSTQF